MFRAASRAVARQGRAQMSATGPIPDEGTARDLGPGECQFGPSTFESPPVRGPLHD